MPALLGGIAAWIGFTLPSAIALVVFALLVNGSGITTAGWLHGLMVVAVAVVAQAMWSMARPLAGLALRRAAVEEGPAPSTDLGGVSGVAAALIRSSLRGMAPPRRSPARCSLSPPT